MGSGNTFEVRVSRWLLLVLIAVGLLFLAAGLDIAVWHVVFGPETITSPVLAVIFAVFAIGIGGLIAVTQAFYLLFPPLMMRITGGEVSFGTGLLYRPYSIPIKYLKSIAIYEEDSGLVVLGRRQVGPAGVELEFERTSSVPPAKATSAGLAYSDYRLRLFKMYMNRPLQKTVDAVKPFVRRW